MIETSVNVPAASSRAIVEHASAAAQRMNTYASLGMRMTERLAELNSQALHASIDEQRAVAMQAADERSPLGAWRLQTSFALASSAKAASYWRHVGEIVLSTYVDTVNETESRLAAGFTAATDAIDHATSGVEQSLQTGDPGEAVKATSEAVQIVDSEGRAVSSNAY